MGCAFYRHRCGYVILRIGGDTRRESRVTIRRTLQFRSGQFRYDQCRRGGIEWLHGAVISPLYICGEDLGTGRYRSIVGGPWGSRGGQVLLPATRHNGVRQHGIVAPIGDPREPDAIPREVHVVKERSLSYANQGTIGDRAPRHRGIPPPCRSHSRNREKDAKTHAAGIEGGRHRRRGMCVTNTLYYQL